MSGSASSYPGDGFAGLRSPLAQANGDMAALLLDHMPTAVALFDREMCYLAASRRWLADYRLVDRQIIGRSHYEVFPEADDAWRAIHRRVLAGETLSDESEPAASLEGGRDGGPWQMLPWRAGDGEIGGAMLFTQIGDTIAESGRTFDGLLRDQPERRASDPGMHELQAELMRITRVSTAGAMANALTHELNQPLTAIVNYLQTSEAIILSGTENALDLVREALAEAGQEALRAGTIVNRLRKFTSSGHLDLSIASPRDLALEGCALAMAGGRSRGVTCEVRVAQGLAEVLVDRLHIQKVLLNLIHNAMDAIGETGAIVIHARPEPRMIRMTVEDTGSGIVAGQEQALFRPFVSGSTTGIGLGLAICQTIVEAHGGRLWCEMAATGGAAFHFTLPVAELDDG